MKTAVLATIAEAQGQRRAVGVVTRLADGVQCLLDAETCAGELLLSPGQLNEARSLLSSGRSSSLSGSDGLFMRAYVPSSRLLIVGAVHIAQALAPKTRSVVRFPFGATMVLTGRNCKIAFGSQANGVGLDKQNPAG